jgi:hypothetical protein
METDMSTKMMRARLLFIACAMAAIALMPNPGLAAPLPSVGCADGDNVCCGEIGDLTCVSYVTNALGNCCGSIGGNSSCWDGTFYVYCNGSGNYCECDAAGNHCSEPV